LSIGPRDFLKIIMVGEASPSLQPPSAFFATPSSGDTPQCPDCKKIARRRRAILNAREEFSLSNASFLRKLDLPNMILNYITVHKARQLGRTLFSS
jgi:hypothetical protein